MNQTKSLMKNHSIHFRFVGYNVSIDKSVILNGKRWNDFQIFFKSSSKAKDTVNSNIIFRSFQWFNGRVFWLSATRWYAVNRNFACLHTSCYLCSYSQVSCWKSNFRIIVDEFRFQKRKYTNEIRDTQIETELTDDDVKLLLEPKTKFFKQIFNSENITTVTSHTYFVSQILVFLLCKFTFKPKVEFWLNNLKLIKSFRSVYHDFVLSNQIFRRFIISTWYKSINICHNNIGSDWNTYGCIEMPTSNWRKNVIQSKSSLRQSTEK